MKTIILSLGLLFSCSVLSAQTAMKTITVGHPFSISLPEYMTRTIGLNTSAALEYKNTVKDVFGFVIIDDKESLRLAEVSFSGVEEFYDDFIKDFIEGEEKVNQSKPLVKQAGTIKFLEADLSYYDKDAKAEIYYLVGMVETANAYYKVLSYCTLENKVKFKEDFRKILYSLKD